MFFWLLLSGLRLASIFKFLIMENFSHMLKEREHLMNPHVPITQGQH